MYKHNDFSDDIIRRGMREHWGGTTIAAMLGISRNAVMGRWRRLQLIKRKARALQTERAKVHTPRGHWSHKARKNVSHTP